MPTNRPYTGWDKNASGRLPGTEALIKLIWSEFGLWNNGSWVVRPKRGKSSPSVHGTGRAWDNSWRGGRYKGSGNYADAKRLMDWLTTPEVADALGIEAVYDYYPKPYGRGWRCDRQETNGGWRVYSKRAFAGAPGGDWVHIEISGMLAHDEEAMRSAFNALLDGEPTPTPEPKPEKVDDSIERGDQGPLVRKIQEILNITVDGDFGPKTEAAVRAFQSEWDLHVDGVVGPKTWSKMQEAQKGASSPAPEEFPDKEESDEGVAYPGRSVRRGHRGELVKLIQEKVGATPDGDFGPKTEAAVKAWQTANGLTSDGIVGPKTWSKMF